MSCYSRAAYTGAAIYSLRQPEDTLTWIIMVSQVPMYPLNSHIIQAVAVKNAGTTSAPVIPLLA